MKSPGGRVALRPPGHYFLECRVFLSINLQLYGYLYHMSMVLWVKVGSLGYGEPGWRHRGEDVHRPGC